MGAPKKPQRKRRDAEQARTDILDAAERRMVKVGPAGIRLQEVARDAGLSHPTVLHHFGSREALVKAVVLRTLLAIHASLVEAISKSTGEEAQLAAMIESVHGALANGGHGRVLLWLALEGHKIDKVEAGLSDVVDAAHALCLARHPRRKIPREDTAHTVVLAALALVASTVMGPILLENAGLEGGAEASKKFRAWLSRSLSKLLEVV